MNSRTKIFIITALGCVVSAALLLLVCQPLLAEVKALNESVSEKDAELTKIQKQIVEYKSAQTDLSRATFKKDIYDTIVSREDLSLALQDLEAAAQETKTTETLQINEPDDPAAQLPDIFSNLALSNEVHYTINFKNNFSGLVDFLQYTEHLPHFTEFDSFHLSAVTQDSEGGGTYNTGDITGNIDGVFLVKNNAQPKE